MLHFCLPKSPVIFSYLAHCLLCFEEPLFFSLPKGIFICSCVVLVTFMLHTLKSPQEGLYSHSFCLLPLHHFQACHSSVLSSTLACFVNNHLFVAGVVATITSDLPVSSIMDRLLDVNICKSSLLNSPPGWD